MKLLTVTHYFDEHRGGIEIVAGRLADGLARKGATVAWLATREKASGAIAPSTDVRRIPVSASTITERMLGFPYPLPSPSALARICKEVSDCDAVLLHDSLYVPCIAAYLAAQWHRKPVVIVQHVGLVPYTNPILRTAMRLANRLLARPLLSRASQVVFISEITARHFSNLKYRRPPELIFNGVDTDVFQPVVKATTRELRRSLGLPDGKPVAVFVGRFVEKKGLAVLAHLARLRPGIVWAFAGWGPLDPRRWDLPNVQVFENLSGKSLAELYCAGDLLVLPSVGEGFPLVVQEALACGLPVVCGSETASADRAATPLLCGVEMVPSDPLATAQLFATAIDDSLSQLGGTTSAARRNLVLQRYCWPQAVDRYTSILGDLAAHQLKYSPEPSAAVA